MSRGDVVLVLTVGGSQAPLRSAIRTQRPRFVAFVCSDATGRHPSSAPEARAIAEAEGLAADAFEIVEVPPDDPDLAGPQCSAIVDELRRRFPDARLRLDYTGGTKTMSASLMLAGIREPAARIELQIMKGERDDLRQVKDGTEKATRLDVDALLAGRTLDQAERFWQRFGYAEAEALLAGPADDLEDAEAVPTALRRRLRRMHGLSAAFAAWDRFDHRTAYQLVHASGTDPLLQAYKRPLKALRSNRDPSPLMVLDLWHNACRRAARGQYEDAIARCYRATEAAAQWLLLEHANLRTKRVDPASAPPALRAVLPPPTASGRLQLGLAQAWEVLIRWGRDPSAPEAVRAASAQMVDRHARLGDAPFVLLGVYPDGTRLRGRGDEAGWLSRRNESILAHGFEAATEETWHKVGVWCEAILVEGLLADVQLTLPQLPRSCSLDM